MKYSSSLRIMTRVLWIGVMGVFVAAEGVAFLTLRKIHNDHLLPGIGARYFIAFIVAFPMVAGLNGFYSVRRRLPSAGDEVISALSVQFLITIVMAYVALLVCMEPIAMALQIF
jgi:hypothetical protein